jgi:flagellar basal-body rod protein FlgF
MENTSLVALSRQIVLQRKLEVIADNVANMNTDGFKRQALNFQEAFMPKARENLFPRRDRASSFVAELATRTDFQEGSIERTGAPLDVAIGGDGFFVIQTAAGERYTRAGGFQVDASGQLVTPDGAPVMGDGGPITFGPNESGILIGPDGTVSSSAGVKGRLRIATFDDPESLVKEGANLFRSDAPALAATSVKLMQGSLERSNVSGVTEMTQLIAVSRAYDQIADVVKKQDELRGRAIDRLSSVQG